MNEYRKLLQQTMQGERPLERANPKPGQSKYYYIDPNQKYDMYSFARPDQTTDVADENSPNPYFQTQQTPVANGWDGSNNLQSGALSNANTTNTFANNVSQSQSSFLSSLQPSIGAMATIQGQPLSIASAGGVSTLKNKENSLLAPSPAMDGLKPFLKEKEDIVPYPYLDMKGKRTSCYGHMDETLQEFNRHPWYNQQTGQPATDSEINYHGYFLFQDCTLLKNQKSFLRYECTKAYYPNEKSIVEFKIEKKTPDFKPRVVSRYDYESTTGRQSSITRYTIADESDD